MRRISVIAVIRDAYAFTFTHLGTIIGLVWMPTLLLTVMGFFSTQHLANDAIEALAGNTAGMGAGFLVWLGYVISSLLLQAIAYVAVVQLALGARSGPVLAHFAFGALEWRMFAGLASFAGLLLAVFLVGSTLISAAARVSPALPALVLVFYAALLMLVARLFLLLPAVAVTDTGPVLRRVWQVGAGNFGRLFAVLLAIAIPLGLLAILLLVPVAGRTPPPAPDSDMLRQQMAMMMWLRQVLPFVWSLFFLIAPLMVGLFAGASVSAWRALKDEAAGIIA